MSDPMVPIHSCHGGADFANVTRKTGLYSSEQLCQIISGSIGGLNPHVNALELATMLCEALEAAREKDETARRGPT